MSALAHGVCFHMFKSIVCLPGDTGVTLDTKYKRSDGSRKRFIFLNRFFFPDHSATSQIVSGLAFHLAASGNDVHAITSRQLYDDPEARLPMQETVNGVRVHRVSTTRYGRSALLGRGLDYLSFYASVWRSALSVVGRGDILIAKTDPPLLSVLAMRVAQRRGAQLVNWLQDLYPEVAVQLGVPALGGQLGQALVFVRDRSLKAATANVAVGNGMAQRLLTHGVVPDHVHVIHNWCDDEQISPVPHADNALRREWGLDDKFVVGYSGNLGRAHEFKTVLDAAEHLRANPDIVFVLIGGGHLRGELAEAVKQRGLECLFRFVPYQNQELLKYSLCVADVHWISLRPELEGLIVPSKFYSIAAAGRPIIAITAEDGEIARLVEEYGCGIVIEPGNADALAHTLTLLSRGTERVGAMGARARAMLEAHFTRQQAFERWQRVLESIA
jgi:glycosyltransferase involved in cell wall biosynthesis